MDYAVLWVFLPAVKPVLLNIYYMMISFFFLLQCWRTRNFDRSQIPVTTGRFLLRKSYMQFSYLPQYSIKLNILAGSGVPQFASLQQE